MHRWVLGLATAVVLATAGALIPIHHAAACVCMNRTEAEALADSMVVFEGVVADGPRELMQPQDRAAA